MSVKKLDMNNISVEEDYSEENPRPREEFAKEFIHALKDAEKFLRGEIKLGNARDLIARVQKEIDEEANNGEC
ncbi:MAG: hypothetical protein FWF32_07655 [Endomicrobia bacterium]|nr:hypothetical protein [Endomicrobiia bacterium]